MLALPGLTETAKSLTEVLAPAEILLALELLLTLPVSLSGPTAVPAMWTVTVATAFTANCPRLQACVVPAGAEQVPWLAAMLW